MFPAQFDYERATTVDEALDLLAEYADTDVELLAGGHSLVPAMKAGDRSPDVVVDVEVAELVGVSVDEDEGDVAVGALTTYADLVNDDSLAEHAPLLTEAAGEVGDRQIRNRGTIGGNLAEAHPAADPPAAVLAADATIVARGEGGEREIPAADLFRGDGETALVADELLTAVRVPDQRSLGTAYVRKTHPATGYAMVGVAAVVDVADGEFQSARVAATGVVDRVVRLAAVEDALAGAEASDDSIERAAADAATGLDENRLRSDPHASGAFRASLLEAYVEHALTEAVERASETREPTP